MICVAVCGKARLQRSRCCSVLQFFALCCSHICCSVLQFVAVTCVAMCCKACLQASFAFLCIYRSMHMFMCVRFFVCFYVACICATKGRYIFLQMHYILNLLLQINSATFVYEYGYINVYDKCVYICILDIYIYVYMCMYIFQKICVYICVCVQRCIYVYINRSVIH